MKRAHRHLCVVALLALLLSLSLSGLAAAKTTLTFLIWGDTTVWQPLLDDFHAKHPDIQIDLQASGSNAFTVQEAFTIRSVAGASPDLVVTHFITHSDVDRLGLYADLTPYIERDNVDIYSQFPRGIIDFFTTEGKITGLPWQLSTMLLWYNKSIFDQNGLGYPSRDWHMTAELIDHARKLTHDKNGDGETDQWGLDIVNFHLWPELFWGTNKWTDDLRHSNLYDPRVRDAFQWTYDLYNTWEISPKTGGGSRAFANGDVAMLGAIQTTMRQLSGMAYDWDVEVMPIAPAGPITYGSGAGFSMAAGAKNPEAAWEFLKYWMTPEAQKIAMEIGWIPGGPAALAEYFGEYDPANQGFVYTDNSFLNKKAIVESYTRTVAQPSPPSYRDVDSVVRAHIPMLKSGEAPPQNVINTLHPLLETALADAWEKLESAQQ